MTQAEQRANELYPNDRAFCGGVASIARDAYIKGCEETKVELLRWANNMYENTMTFVQGDTKVDNAVQVFALRIVKKIEQL